MSATSSWEESLVVVIVSISLSSSSFPLGICLVLSVLQEMSTLLCFDRDNGDLDVIFVRWIA